MPRLLILGRLRGTLRSGCALLAVAWLAGCAAGYGGLQPDPAVTQMFQSNTAPESFRYYLNGRSQLPYAIIGIDPRFHLSTDQWEPVPYSDLARKGRALWIPEEWYRLSSPAGAWIVDSQGRQVGIWYSMYPNTSIQVGPANQVIVYSPYLPGHE